MNDYNRQIFDHVPVHPQMPLKGNLNITLSLSPAPGQTNPTEEQRSNVNHSEIAVGPHSTFRFDFTGKP
jgi:hypothetical protein